MSQTSCIVSSVLPESLVKIMIYQGKKGQQENRYLAWTSSGPIEQIRSERLSLIPLPYQFSY
jgi:hypothetical protein